MINGFPLSIGATSKVLIPLIVWSFFVKTKVGLVIFPPTVKLFVTFKLLLKVLVPDTLRFPVIVASFSNIVLAAKILAPEISWSPLVRTKVGLVTFPPIVKLPVIFTLSLKVLAPVTLKFWPTLISLVKNVFAEKILLPPMVWSPVL